MCKASVRLVAVFTLIFFSVAVLISICCLGEGTVTSFEKGKKLKDITSLLKSIAKVYKLDLEAQSIFLTGVISPIPQSLFGFTNKYTNCIKGTSYKFT